MLCIYPLQSLIAAQSPAQNILVLHSYHEGYEWTDELNQGILSTLSIIPDNRVFVEYMDVIRFPEIQHLNLLQEIYIYRYADKNLQLIIVADDDAFRFMLERGESMFPDVPVVFTGVDDYHPEQLIGRSQYKGIDVKPSIRETLEVAIALSPQAKRLAVISGSRLTEQIFYRQFMENVDVIPSHIQFIPLEMVEPEDIAQQLSEFTAEDIVIYLSWLQTPSGRHFSVAEAVNNISEASPARIFSIREFTLPHGVVGGKMVNPFMLGETTAFLALDLLSGKPLQTIPLMSEGSNRFIFNGRILNDYNISVKSLPINSLVVNRSPEFMAEVWENLHKNGVFGYDFFENHGVVMLIVDPVSGVIVDANRAAYIYYGFAGMAGMNISQINTLTQQEIYEEMLKARRFRKNYFEFRHRLANDEIRDVRVYSYPVYHDNLELLASIVIDRTEELNALYGLSKLYNTIVAISAVVLIALIILVLALLRNIKQRKWAQNKLGESEKRYKDLFNNLMDVVFSCDPHGNVLQINPVVTELFGDQKVMGENIWKFLLQGEQKKWKEKIEQSIAEGQKRFTFETRVVNFKGDVVHLEINGFIMFDPATNEVKEVFGIARNVTESKHLSRKILKATIEAQENERKRLAFELHDGIGPLLSGMKMYLQQDALAEGMSPRQMKILGFCRQILDDAISQTRSISRKLAPGMLHDLGLRKALEGYIAKLELADKCRIKLHTCEKVVSLDKDTALSVYRIVTELVNNAILHSGCTEMDIDIAVDADCLGIKFTENGKGFDVEHMLADKSRKGMGLFSIMSRVKMLDGGIKFLRPAGAGMKTFIEIPLQVPQ